MGVLYAARPDLALAVGILEVWPLAVELDLHVRTGLALDPARSIFLVTAILLFTSRLHKIHT